MKRINLGILIGGILVFFTFAPICFKGLLALKASYDLYGIQVEVVKKEDLLLHHYLAPQAREAVESQLSKLYTEKAEIEEEFKKAKDAFFSITMYQVFLCIYSIFMMLFCWNTWCKKVFLEVLNKDLHERLVYQHSFSYNEDEEDDQSSDGDW